MIDKPEIDAKSEELGVNAANVQRDYVFGWLLSGVSQGDNPLRPLLILKGGNCFRKAYFEHARFSNDLDFSTQSQLDLGVLLTGLKQASTYARERSGVEFLIDDSRVSEKRLADAESRIYEARVYFKSFYGEEEARIRVDLDVKEYDRIFLPIQTQRLIHSYSDAPPLSVRHSMSEAGGNAGLEVEGSVATSPLARPLRLRSCDLFSEGAQYFATRGPVDFSQADHLRAGTNDRAQPAAGTPVPGDKGFLERIPRVPKTVLV
jgi:hypothetical protein